MAEKEKKKRLLTEDLYRQDRSFFRRAIAYRLLHMFTPKPLTRLLPRGLRRPLLGVGSIVPAGVPTFPGMVVPPGMEIPYSWAPWFAFMIDEAYDLPDIFPPGWTPGDPMPDEIDINTSVIFPPGWTPGDPLPDGITVDPGTSFPPGWTPGDALPDGVNYDWSTIIPSDWTPENPPPGSMIPGYDPSITPTPDGPAPPANLDPNQPGPPHITPSGPTAKEYYIELEAENDAVIMGFSATSWDEVHNSIGADKDSTSKYMTQAVIAEQQYDWWRIWRAFFHFNLTWMPSNATIMDCTLRLFCCSSWTCSVVLQKSTHETWFPLESFNAFEGNLLAVTTPQYGVNEIPLNSAGIQVIHDAIGDFAKICIRENDHDLKDVPPPSSTTFRVGFCFKEATNEIERPLLKITYKA